jgi:hypothetical protein
MFFVQKRVQRKGVYLDFQNDFLPPDKDKIRYWVLVAENMKLNKLKINSF